MAYDIMFFEALGEEKHHLAEALEASKRKESCPRTFVITLAQRHCRNICPLIRAKSFPILFLPRRIPNFRKTG